MANKITGCIVTYNNIKTIGKAIGSVLEFTKQDFHLYVVDNGSTDGTIEYIEKNFPEVTIITIQSNMGFGAGHDTILRVIDSDYHCIINPDIIIRDDVITKMAEFLDNNPDIGMLSPQIKFPDGRPQILGKKIPLPHYLVASRLRGKEPSKLLKEYAMIDSSLDEPVDIQNATGCFMFIRTELFKKVGGFDNRYFMYFEDCDLARQINEISRVVYYPYATVYHEWGRESKKNIKLKFVQIESMFKYYSKWGLGDTENKKP